MTICKNCKIYKSTSYCIDKKCKYNNYNKHFEKPFILCNECKIQKGSLYCINKHCKFCCNNESCKKHYGIPENINDLTILEKVLMNRYDIPRDIMNIISTYVDNGKGCEICGFRNRGNYKECFFNNCKKLYCEKCSVTCFCKISCCSNCYNDFTGECKFCEKSRKYEEEYETFKSYF